MVERTEAGRVRDVEVSSLISLRGSPWSTEVNVSSGLVRLPGDEEGSNQLLASFGKKQTAAKLALSQSLKMPTHLGYPRRQVNRTAHS